MDIPSWLAIGADLATIVGIPIAIGAYLADRRRDRHDREYGTYDALDQKYLEYLRLVMDNPHLDLYTKPLASPPALEEREQVRQLAMFEILVSLLERAFLMYRGQSTQLQRAQWTGWVAFLEDWAAMPTFRRLWRETGEQFDRDFVRYVDAAIERCGAPPAAS